MSAPAPEPRARLELVRYSRAMHAAGWVANHDGNLSARVAPGRVVLTPTAFGKADVRADDLVVVDPSGRKIAGRQRPFSEMNLHLAIYRARPEVHAVVHAHPPTVTAYGAAGKPLPHPFLPEAVVSLGASIPLVPLAAPGQPAADALAPFIRRCDAVLLAGNGALAWGPDLETAYLRLELVEHLGRIAWAAEALGGVQRLPQAMVEGLVAKRRKGGLAAPDEPGASSPAPAESPDLAARAAAAAIAAIPGADRAQAEALAREILQS